MFRARAGDNYLVVLATTLLLGTTFTSVGAQTLSFGPTGAGGSGSWDNTTANWFNGSTAVPWASGNTAAFGGTAGTVTASGTVAVGSMTFSTSGYTITGGTLALSGTEPVIATNAGVSATINSAITGSATLVKSGAGMLTFSGAKAYTGPTIVDAGRLVLDNVSGFVSATTVNSAATLTFAGTTNVTAGPRVTLNDGAALENNNSGSTMLTGAVTSTGNTSINVNHTSGTGRGLILDGGLHGSGTVTINAANAGNGVSLRNNNSTFGGTLVINGIASSTAGAGSGLALAGAATSNALINTNVVLNGTIELADQGMGWANAWFTSRFNLGALSGSGIMVANRNPTGNFGSTVVLGNTNDSGLFSGSIVRGSGRTNVVGVTKVGTGTQIFSGANSYTGVTNVNVGVLNIRNNTALGTTAGGTNVASGAALQIEGDIAVGAEALTLNGTGIANDGALRNMSGVNSYAGPISLGSAVRINSDAGVLTLGAIAGAAQNLTLGGAGGTTVAGVLGTTSGTLTKDGSGIAILSGTNTYTGATIVNGGILQAGAAAGGRAFGTLSAVTLADVAGATLNLDSFNQTIGSLNGGGTTGGNVILGSATLTTGGNGTSTTFGGAISGTGALVKVGSGTQILAGTNTYTGGTMITAGRLQLGNGGTSGSIIGNVSNNGTLAFNRSDSTTFSGMISGTGAMRQIGSGLTNLTGDSSAFAGTTAVEAGTLAVNGSLCGDMNVLTGGRLQGIGFVCTTSNAGVVAPGNSLGTLTVNGNYTGNAGLLEIESVLGGDASPSDRLVVTGDTAGSSRLKVLNVGGVGARTVEGIKIIDVGGTSNGTFTLSGDYALQGQQVIVAGAYGYTLQQNGVSTPTDGDWYLRSSLATAPADPDSPTPPVSSGPLYQPGVPLFETYAQVLLGLNGVSTLEQRVGTRAWSPDTAPAAAKAREGLWGRIEGSRQVFEPSRTTSGANYESDQLKLQMGLDSVVVENGNGKLVAGLTAQYGTVSADVTSRFGGGKIDTDGYGVGATLTWYGHNGFYADVQAQAIRFDSDIASTLIGRTLASGNDGSGYALSGETGERLGLGGGWSMTPQAQLAYSSVDFDGFTDVFGARVTSSDGDSLRGRLGLSADFESVGETGRSKVYGIANLYYEFLDGTAASVAGVSFANANDRLWGGIGAGGGYSWSGDKYALYGEVSVNTSLAHVGDSYSLGGTGGFRMTW